MTETIYPYARLYAKSEKDMSEALDRIVGKGRWMKTKIMIDTYAHAGRGEPTGNSLKDKPKWVSSTGFHPNGTAYTAYHPAVYRGVIFADDEAGSLAAMFLNSPDARQDDDLVLVRSWHRVEITPKARYWGIGEKGLPWETKEEAAEHWPLALASRSWIGDTA